MSLASRQGLLYSTIVLTLMFDYVLLFVTRHQMRGQATVCVTTQDTYIMAQWRGCRSLSSTPAYIITVHLWASTPVSCKLWSGSPLLAAPALETLTFRWYAVAQLSDRGSMIRVTSYAGSQQFGGRLRQHGNWELMHGQVPVASYPDLWGSVGKACQNRKGGL